MYKDTNNTDARAKEFACSVGITMDIAKIFTSRIPEETEPSKQCARKENNYLKIWNILDQIADLKGLLDVSSASETFFELHNQETTQISATPEFKRFAVLDFILCMKFPHEVKKSDLTDDEISALYSWLTKT